MKKINQVSAIFNIKLHNHIMVMWPEDSPINYTIPIGNKDVELTLEKCFSNKFKDEGDKYYTEPVYEINIQVTTKGVFKIPEVEIKNKTIKDYTKRINYFDKLLPSFAKPAHEVYTRLIYFLKYLLYNPYLIEFPQDHVFFHNAKWIDSNGKEIGNNTYKLPLVDVYELEVKLGKNIPIQKLSPKVAKELELMLNNPIQPELHSQMLSGAVSSLFDLNLHRAIVESAIACEIMVKRAFFPKDTPSGSAFDYFEDKSRIKIRVPELIDKVAK